MGFPATPEAVVEAILALYAARGARLYDGAVDQVEHGVQAALLAERAGASPALIAAALLHDVGHLVEDGDAVRGADGFHERLGARFLAPWFPQAVVAPVALHVAAKRYLVATDPAYAARLSLASQRSLDLQGGPLPREEALRFESLPHAEAAVRVRRWDDDAKVGGLALPPLAAFTAVLRDLVVQPANADETWDAGDLGCGELVLELRTRMVRMQPGRVMKLVALDPGAPADIPAWCRMTGHTLVGSTPPVYLIRRKES